MFMLPTVDEIYYWLGTLGVSLWADWYIESPDRRRLAAEWFHKQMTDVTAHTLRGRNKVSFQEYLAYPNRYPHTHLPNGTHTRVDL